jgi:hypothetical protein
VQLHIGGLTQLPLGKKDQVLEQKSHNSIQIGNTPITESKLHHRGDMYGHKTAATEVWSLDE